MLSDGISIRHVLQRPAVPREPGFHFGSGFTTILPIRTTKILCLRQSTRLTCMYVSGGQTSYDPRFIRQMFPGANVYKHPALFQLYDADLNELDDLPKEKYELFAKVSPINYVTKDDAPVILSYGMAMEAKPDIHHPLFGKLLKEKMDKLGIRCEVYAGEEVLGGSAKVSCLQFIRQEFGMK